MSLSIASQTALSGLRAAESMVSVAAGNLANAYTPGYRQQQLQLATNPVLQSPPASIGRGVQVASVSEDPSPTGIPEGSGSNTDIGQNLIGLFRAETLFRANLAVLDVSDSLLDELLHLPRR